MQTSEQTVETAAAPEMQFAQEQTRSTLGITTRCETGGQRLLSAEQEHALALAWRRDHCRESRERLITRNMALVISIARRYTGRGIPLDELIAEGNIGLITAVDNFDPDIGTRLSTYAVYWIRHSISKVFADSSPRSRLSRAECADVTALDRNIAAFATMHGREPRPAELAESLGWRPDRVRITMALRTTHARAVSLSLCGAEQRSVSEHCDGETDSEDAAEGRGRTIEQVMSALSPPERRVVELRYGLGTGRALGVRDIARSVGVPPRVVKMRLELALRKLAHVAERLSPACCGVLA